MARVPCSMRAIRRSPNSDCCHGAGTSRSNIFVEDYSRMPALAVELIRRQVAVIAAPAFAPTWSTLRRTIESQVFGVNRSLA
jgi:hypothetical protein